MLNLQHIPSVDHLLNQPYAENLLATYGREWVLSTIRAYLAQLRISFQAGASLPTDEEILRAVEAQLAEQARPTLHSVINATGVILHTNLGRAPLSRAALSAVQDAALNYSTLEFDLTTGKRGKRDLHCTGLLNKLTGAEASLVVNNNAGALLLALSALFKGKRVAISRSQLIEIGDGFRIPDVMRQSGTKLIEVGSTNRTHLTDFETAIAEGANAIFLAHPSNFKIIGFTAEPGLPELISLAHASGLPVLYDLGSGALVDTSPYGLAHETTVQEVLKAGASLVFFSGDKLLGGPQAGIIVGKKEYVDKIRKHPLYRALRSDKLCLAALAATLLHYLKGEAETEIPIYQMLSRSADSLHTQVEHWQQALQAGELIPGFSTVGGGSLPEETLPTWLWAYKPLSLEGFLKRLRQFCPAIVARVESDQVVLDPRTVLPGQEETLLVNLRALLSETKERK